MHALSILPLILAIPLTPLGAMLIQFTTPATASIPQESISSSQGVLKAESDNPDDCPLRGCGRRYEYTSDRGSGRIQGVTA